MCRTCSHRAYRVRSKNGGNFALWGCVAKKISFGNNADWLSGVNLPKKCGKYENGEKNNPALV